MNDDIFISYSRRDNSSNQISQLVERIKTDFKAFSGRELRIFFDVEEIRGMDDWRHRILDGLKRSHLFLACLSPSYLESEYCEWEFNEYSKHEIGRFCGFEGIAPLYFVEVPGWNDKLFEQNCKAWVTELRRRQQFDFRPWSTMGIEALRNADVQERMTKLNEQIKERILRGERARQAIGNVDSHNPHFMGRRDELRRLRENVTYGRAGVLTVIHGVGGLGKTALAIEYAHSYAELYGGGRWQVPCEGKEDLRAVITELASPLEITFSDDEKRSPVLQFERVKAKLHTLAKSGNSQHSLIILDNVDKANLLDVSQTKHLPSDDWLHIVVTSRLGEQELAGNSRDRAFLAIDEISEKDALALIESHQPNGKFANDTERDAALEIVRFLGNFTLAVESVAVYLGHFSSDISCAAFLARLEKEGLEGLDSASDTVEVVVRHGEKRLNATLQQTLERLNEAEKLVLNYAAFFPTDQIVVPWLRELLAQAFPEYGKDAEPGYPDPWSTLLRRLISLRLIQITGIVAYDNKPLIVRMHRLIHTYLGDFVADSDNVNLAEKFFVYMYSKTEYIAKNYFDKNIHNEIKPLISLAIRYAKLEIEYVQSMIDSIVCLAINTALYSDAKLLCSSMLVNDLKKGNDKNISSTYSKLSIIEENIGNLTEAIEFAKLAIKYNMNDIVLENNIANIYEKIGNTDEALNIKKNVATFYLKQNKREDLMYALLVSNLSTAEFKSGNILESYILSKKSMTIREKLLPAGHLDIAKNCLILASIARKLGLYVESKSYSEKSLFIFLDSLPENHPAISDAYSEIALSDRSLGNIESAKASILNAIEILERNDTINKYKLANLLAILALIEHDLGNLVTAKVMNNKAIDIARSINDKIGESIYCNNLSFVEMDLGLSDSAKDAMFDALSSAKKILSENHPDIDLMSNNYSYVVRNTVDPFIQYKQLNRVEKIGRNDSCPCGSNKKYKKCCGA
ncbi:TIR domain-containing protein [Trichlorobacter sp.]|uniref:TIR domain-containing protein n=1 Tax=Trichlorobacter sp. TaxID=2911007 RepID=UPI002A37232F|nr:TIR domain-containing protein [Trichlorobacter sp.]MDY0384538.1 TIR domain-containing protein [Trichlorobacter sp.]